MRDLQRLQELSSTAALGLWADDVVLALHRATTASAGPDEADKRLLSDAADTLVATMTRVDQPLSPSSSARDLATTDTALRIVVTLADEHAGADVDRTVEIRHLLSNMVDVLRAVATGALAPADSERIEPVFDFFGTVGEAQLVESNSVLASWNDAGTWTATRTTSSS
jgi:hypothetical protein